MSIIQRSKVLVFVIGLTGRSLMPMREKKARILLKEGKAEVFMKLPFTIRLLYKTGGATQHINLGIDTGSQHIGIGVVSDSGHVLHKEEIALRQTMRKRALIEARKSYRSVRRYRKVRYRHPKWRYHTIRGYVPEGYKKKGWLWHWRKKRIVFDSPRPKGWLPPSIQQKVDHHIAWIGKYQRVLPAGTTLKLELARFDIARLKDPSVHGELYQQGTLYGWENVKAYIFARDGYKCQCCGKKAAPPGRTVPL